MEEQSHKGEMRAALRGDFERLQSRRQTGVSQAAVERSGPGSQAAEAPVCVPAPTPAPAQRSWLDRLRGCG